MTTLVQIKSQLIRSIPAESVYRIQLDIIDVVNIDFDVLVFDAEHDTFSRVCTVYDLETFPVGKAAAISQGVDYYRGRGAQLNFATLRDATGFETITTHRLKLLAVSWGSVVNAFSGSDIISVDSSTT